MEKYYIKSEDWKKIYTFLKTRQDVRVGSEGKTRTFGEAIRFIMHTEAQWRELPVYYGNFFRILHANIIADKGYDYNALIDQIQEQNCIPAIPCRSNRKIPREYDEHLYKKRHLVKCFFNKIKHFRHIFSRFVKKASFFAGFLAYASFILWLR